MYRCRARRRIAAPRRRGPAAALRRSSRPDASPEGAPESAKLARNLLIPSGTQRGKRESAGRGGTGLAMCALREPGVGCRGTSDPFFLPVVPFARDADTFDGPSPRPQSFAGTKKNGAMRRFFLVRCRRPTGSGTGGIRNSPPGSAILTVIRRIATQPVNPWLACDQFLRDASGFRALDRDGILVPGDRIDLQAVPSAAAAAARPVPVVAAAAGAVRVRHPAPAATS